MSLLERRENKIMDRILKNASKETIVSKKSSSRALRKALSNKLTIFGLIVFVIIIFMCIFAPIFTKHDPYQINLSEHYAAPSSEHILGTDALGRDIFSKILYGGRLSIFIGFGSAIGSTIVGAILGCLAGYRRGIADALLLRISELIKFFPQIILVLILVVISGQSLYNLILIFIVTGWISIFRITRAKMLSLKEEEYVQALKVLGLNDTIIIFKHILPNAIGPIVVNLTLQTALFILQEAVLSFVGLGVPLEIPTWGNILNAANNLDVIRQNWWVWLPVGLVISLFVLSINFVGDGLRDATDVSLQG